MDFIIYFSCCIGSDEQFIQDSLDIANEVWADKDDNYPYKGFDNNMWIWWR